MTDDNIISFLESHEDAKLKLDQVDTAKLKDWLADLDSKTRAGVQRAWLIGRVLNAERATLQHGDVEEWEKQKAQDLGRKVRTLQLYRFIAKAVDDPKIATKLRISHADRGLNGLVSAIRREQKKSTGDAENPEQRDKGAIWAARAERLLKALPDVEGRTALLKAHMVAVEKLLGKEGIEAASAKGNVKKKQPSQSPSPTADPAKKQAAPIEPAIPAGDNTQSVASGPVSSGDKHSKSAGKPPTVGEAAKAYLATLAENQSKSTIKPAKWALKRFAKSFGDDRLLCEISQADIDSCWATITLLEDGAQKALSPKSISQLKTQLSKAQTWWHGKGWNEALLIPGSGGRTSG